MGERVSPRECAAFQGLTKEQLLQQANDRVAANTYPFIAWAARDLHARLQGQIERFVEPVGFGTTALDIGSRDGRYMQVIREMGFKGITAIDPSPELQKGIDEGYIKPDEAFQRTLEEYVRSGGRQVDTVFLLNVNPDLPRSQQFIDTLMQVVKPGGIVVSSCIEPETAINLAAKTYWTGDLNTIREFPKDSKKRELELFVESREVDQGWGLNNFLSIGRRAAHTKFDTLFY